MSPENKLTPQEIEILLRAEVEATARGMQDGLQQFADMRDRNMRAWQKLVDLWEGVVA